MAAKKGSNADYKKAAAIIFGSNPLGGICGYVCPDFHCMKACVHRTFDNAVNIPPVQATIIKKAKELNNLPDFINREPNGKRVAVIGSGPAGLGAASVLAQKGYSIEIFEKENKPGGMCNLIPDIRLDKKVLKSDIEFLLKLGNIKIHYGKEFAEIEKDAKFDNNENNYNSNDEFNAIIFASGLTKDIKPGIQGEELSYDWIDFLKNHKKLNLKNKKVTIIGGGAVAVDCAVTASIGKASAVEMIMLEKLDEMPLTSAERNLLVEYNIEITCRTQVNKISSEKKKIKGIQTQKVLLQAGKKFHPKNIKLDKSSNPTNRTCKKERCVLCGRYD
jgi:dihydropyrimidine dehydrogenase (NAD+) subunit PreT